MPELDLAGYEPPHLDENDIFSPTTQNISTESSQNTLNSHRRHSNYDFGSLAGLRRKFQGLFSLVNEKRLLIFCGFTIVILFIALISVSCSVARADFEIQETLKKLQSQLADIENVQLNLSLQLQSEFTSDVTGCGYSWIPYKHDKCVKILDKLFTHEEAEAECVKEITENSPQLNLKMIPLLTIDSSQEQQFLDRLIFIDSKILDNVWLGSQRQVKGNESIFLWKFGSSSGNGNGTGNSSLADVNFHFENWQPGSPSSTLENRCVHMVPHGTRISGGWSHDVDGQWQDAPCRRRNVVVCQKPQVFSLANLKSYFVQFKKETTRKSQSLEKIAGSVPVGFIYFQYRNQSAPSDLWPQLTWEEVTNFYSGEFFRALGNETSSFGQIQRENAPRVTRVSYNAGVPGETSVTLPLGAESGSVASISRYNSGAYSSNSISFFTSGGEVRPKNSAVKIWKRI